MQLPEHQVVCLLVPAVVGGEGGSRASGREMKPERISDFGGNV